MIGFVFGFACGYFGAPFVAKWIEAIKEMRNS